jgi:hypothetical protein
MLVIGAVVASYILDVTEWRVMKDELLYLDLSRSIADTLNPLPVERGELVSVYSVLYPLIIAPFVGFLDAPAAFQAIRLVNVCLMVSTAIPAYLLARQGSPSRAASVLAATLSVLVPWMGQSTSVMTEVAAYPAFAWAVYGMTRAIAAPTLRRDVVALAGIAVACLARTQFLVLLLAFPVAALLHEIGQRIALDGVRNVRSALVQGTRQTVRAHAVVALVWMVSILLLAFASSVLLGSYEATTSHGSVLPAGLPRSAVEHLAYIAVGMGALPIVFCFAFVLGTLGRAVDARPHALAAVLLVVLLSITVAVTSFDLRFVTLGRTVQERYLFYICPLVFAGAVAWFANARVSVIPAAIAAFGTAGIVLSRGYEPVPEISIEGFASPNRYFFAVMDGRLRQAESHLGLHSPDPALFIAAGCILFAGVAVALVRSGRRREAFVAFALIVGAFLIAQLVYVLPRVVDDHNRYARTVLGVRPLGSRDWVDERVTGSTGAVESGPIAENVRWWDLEFWNKSIDRVYRFGDHRGFQPLRLQFGSGTLIAGGGRPPQHLVLASSNVRFAPEHQGAPMRFGGFTLYRTPVPYRAAWATEGVDEDGWTRAGRTSVVRVYADRGRSAASLRRIRIVLGGGANIARPRGYTLTANSRARRGIVHANRIEQIDVCPPPGGHTDVTLRVHGHTQLSPGQLVGLRVLSIEDQPVRRSCRPA